MMESFTEIKTLNQKKLSFHIVIVLLSSILSLILSIGKAAPFPSEFQINLFLLMIIQLEVFIWVAHRIFSGFRPVTSRKELTRTVLLRFSLFMVICFVAALIIVILFNYLLSLIHNSDSSDIVKNFFRYEFKGWSKGTIGGLLFGAAIFIFIQWQDALKREQKLREENLIFLNETLKNQINPHFLFNSLNTLSAFISTSPDTAERFIGKLSSIYRYILENSQKTRVPLLSELAFIEDYFDLHRVRDEDKIGLTIKAPDAERFEILPVSLQILIENAIKHNIATREKPLQISISIENDHMVIRNNLQKMPVQFKSTHIGLKNLAERVKLITGKNLVIEEENSFFIVKVPLLL